MKKVYFENLIAGGLLKFEKINGLDVYIFIEDISNNGVIYSSEIFNIIEKYIIDEDAIIKLKNPQFKCRLKQIQGDVIKEYFEKLDLEIFTLKKLRLVGPVAKEVIENYFDGSQIDYFDYLYIQRYISIEDNNFVITRDGLLKLFLIENSKLLEIFQDDISKSGLNVSFLNDYLSIQEDFNDINSILNINNYKMFCSKFSRKLNKLVR